MTASSRQQTIAKQMSIKEICNTITNYFKKIRPPFKQLPRVLLVCSMIRRPGLSVTQSSANIVKDLNALGIPTNSMPDGSDNLTVAFVYTVVKEIFRALRMDAAVQVGIQPGSLTVTAFGENAGGPITVIGTTTSHGNGHGCIV